jgi:4-amino-4-deoxy-L-arabinose transferase-like glycosyltransferase
LGGVDLSRRAYPVILGLAAVVFALHIYVASFQYYYGMVDDVTYLNAAIHILERATCPLAVGNACNYEHPPLTKMFEALGFAIFGRVATFGPAAGVGANQFGGRIFQMVMQSLSAPVVYLVVNKMSGNWKMAFVAALFMLVDPLYFSLSTTAALDSPMVFFAILALVPLAYGMGIGRVDGYLLTGGILGLSLLCKESALFIVLAVVSYILVLGDLGWKTRLLGCVKLLLAAAIVFCVGLEIYVAIFTNFPSFLSEITLMASFHVSAGPGQLTYLTEASNCNLYVGLCPDNRSLLPHFLYSGLPLAPVISGNCFACWSATNPLDWLTYFPPVVFSQSIMMVANYPLVWMCFAWVPFGLVKLRSLRVAQEGKVLILAGSIFIWNLASNIVIFSVFGRAVFEWYFLPAVPAMAMGGAYLVTLSWLPRWARYGLIVAVVIVGIILSPYVYNTLYPGPQVCEWC